MNMDAHSIPDDHKEIHDLNEALPDDKNDSNQEVIVVDGRGYDNDSLLAKEVYTLVDVIEENQTGNKLYEDVMKKAEEILERIARKIVPEIAERIIKEEIEKIKKGSPE